METIDRVKVFGEADERTLQQMQTCIEAEEGAWGVLCSDNHLGYSAPIGSAVAYKDHVSVSGVGFDIACGNKAMALDLFYEDIKDDLPRIMDEIESRISFGIGRVNNEPVDHVVIDYIGEASLPEVRALKDLAERQLGTVGSGNHYVDIFMEQGTGRIWIGVHFGSRGFGHKIATGFLSLAQGLSFDDKYKEGGMMDAPTLLKADSELGQTYIEAMRLAGIYAYAGRDVVVEKVKQILGQPQWVDYIHNHHNYMWKEEYGGEEFWVVRKGSTPLYPFARAFVGATMGENSVILQGKPSREAENALFSAPHGAGRVMSRTQAAGKWKKKWVNNVRDDDAYYDTREDALNALGATKAQKVRVRVNGKIDYPAVLDEMKELGVEVRGGAADEAPGAYKRLPEVLAAHESTLSVKHVLKPIGVCMAGEKVQDPYKD